MGGKKSFCAQPPSVGAKFQYSTRNRHAVKGRCTTAYFIKYQKAFSGGVL
jgi:hypothetical protein